MYEPLLFIHSWTRWSVLLALLYFFWRSTVGWARKQKWEASDAHFIWAFNQVFGYQVAFGFTLWLALSPFTKAGFRDFGSITENPLVFFWTIRHGGTMLLAYGIFHMGKARAKRIEASVRFRHYSIVFGVILLLIVSAIPWPWLSYGRSLFRWFS